MVINREIDRIQINKSSNNRIKRTFTDDSYAAFSFFMTLFAQVFSPSKTLFSNEFVELIEEVNNKKVTYGKKHDVCCDGSVKITISYLTNQLDRLTYDEDEKRVPNVYDSVVDSFGVDFSSNSNSYYPKGGRKVLFEERLIYGKRVSSETFEDCGYMHLYEKHNTFRRN